jgi:hypothetical protein
MFLKPSSYNFYFPIEAHGAALFNSRTGAAMAVDEATSRAIVLLLQDPQREIPAGSNFHRTKDMLVREGFLVPRLGIQVNAHLICRISRRKFASHPADFLLVLTLPLDLLALIRPRAKRRTTAMFLAP